MMDRGTVRGKPGYVGITLSSNVGRCRSTDTCSSLPTPDEGAFQMQKRLFTLATALIGGAFIVACGSDKPTAPSNITYR